MRRPFRIAASVLLAACTVTAAPAPPQSPRPVAVLPSAQRDYDGDGFVDPRDRCPRVIGREPDGCPPPDSDGDLFPDAVDRCRHDLGVEPDGCPIPDADADGILDGYDRCVTFQETRNSYFDEDGCPDEIPRDLRRYIGIIHGVEFRTHDELLPSARRVLDRAAVVLARYPAVHIEITGHIDSSHGPQYGRDPSKSRAHAVKRHLVERGIAESRLSARGVGPDEPLDTNKTAAGRARNQRIEFTLIRGD